MSSAYADKVRQNVVHVCTCVILLLLEPALSFLLVTHRVADSNGDLRMRCCLTLWCQDLPDHICRCSGDHREPVVEAGSVTC